MSADLLGTVPGIAWSVRKGVILIATIIGLGLSTYLTIVHYDTAIHLSCPTTSVFNCETVQQSPQSIVFGIPVAVLGLAFYVGMLGLALPVSWRMATIWVARLRLASVVVGIGFVCYLVYTELFTIHAVCLWCSGVHLLTFVIFVAVVTGWEEATEAPDSLA